MIQEFQYWNGNDSRFRLEWTEAIKKNGRDTVAKINRLLELAAKDGICCDQLSSGWRPAKVNSATSNSAKNSLHITGEACDLADPNRALAQWCILNLDKLDKIGLWMEDPRWTPTWVHLQTRPPKSGKRVYIPNNQPPKALPLNGQKSLPMTIKV